MSEPSRASLELIGKALEGARQDTPENTSLIEAAEEAVEWYTDWLKEPGVMSVEMAPIKMKSKFEMVQYLAEQAGLDGVAAAFATVHGDVQWVGDVPEDTGAEEF